MQTSETSTGSWFGDETAMARQINTLDWSKHPLGKIPTWQQSLKTIVQTMLQSQSAMWLGWGSELYFLCNDACMQTLGNKSVWALGAPAQRVWAEIWPDIGPSIDSVLQTGRATWNKSLPLFLDRNGCLEETYQSFSCSPVVDDAGAIGGMLCVVTDDTERVIVERRLALSREVAALTRVNTQDQLFEAIPRCFVVNDKDFPFALLYIFSPDGSRAFLACAHGAGIGDAIAPAFIDVESSTLWPARQILTDNQPIITDDLSKLVSVIPTGPWKEAAKQAAVLPIIRPGQARPVAFLVAAINPHQNFDAKYRGYCELIASQIAAVLAIAGARDEERERASALNASEARYRATIHGLPAAVYTTDALGRITLYNKAAAALWGREPQIGVDEWCGSVKIFRPDGTSLPLDKCPMAVALKERRPIKGEEIIIERPDGSRRHVLANPQPILNESGAVTGALNMLLDVTESQAAQRALQQSEERFRLATQTGKVGVWDWDIVRNTVSWTDSLYAIHGLKQGDFAGTIEAFTALIHSEDRKRVSAAIDRAMHEDIPCDLEFRLLRPDGEVAWITTHASAIRENGRPVRMLGATVDITDRKRAEMALRESERRAALELSAMQQLHQMTTHLLGMREIPNALEEVLDASMQIQNADFGKVQVYNPTLQILELVAHRGFPEKLLGYFASVSRDHDSASGIAFKLKQRVIIEDVESYSDYPLNRDVAALAGYRAAQATPLLSRSGELLGMLSTHFRRPRRPNERELRILDLYARQAADFIEVLNIEQEVRKSRELLQQQANELEEQLIASGRLVSLGEVTASMAHEFNNPLGIILGFVQDMLNSTESDDRDYRALQIINEEAERCRRIVQRLMDLSRPQPTELSPTKLDDVIMRTVSLVESRLYKQKIDLETALQPDLPKVLADYQQIEQVLVNLVFNAIDAMPDGGKLTIAAQTARRNGRSSMMLSVSDTGVGIDNESMSKIFLPFYTAGKKRGLGLGLSICERIVKNHRGRLEVESCVGGGTTFKFYLPLYHEPMESRESAMLS